MPGQEHLRIRLNGEFGPEGSPPADIFSYGLNMQLGAGADYDSAAIDPALVAAAAAYHSDPETGIYTNRVRLTEVAVSHVLATGIQQGNTRRYVTNAGGGISTSGHPPQVAYKVSLGTGFRGRSNRGGYYVPGPGFAINDADFRMTAAACAGALASAHRFLVAMQNAAQGRVVISSKIAGNLTVTQIRVGRVFDTIRSRRNAMVEDYVEQVLEPLN